MSIKKVEMYSCRCDNCGEPFGSYEYEHLLMPDESSMKWALDEDDEWHTEKGNPDKHYCRDCFIFDDDDNLIIDETRRQNHKP